MPEPNENVCRSPLALLLSADADSLRAAHEALREGGCSVRSETSVYRAVASFASNPADIALLDLDALDERQLECVGIFREINPDALILCLFSPDRRRFAAESVRRGADSCLAQPFYPGELETLLRRWAYRVERRILALASQRDNLDSLARLARGTAHEINNPLTTLSGWMQMMADEAGDRKRKNRLNSMLEEADRVAAVVRRLLDFGQEKPEELMPVDLNALLTSLLDEMESKHTETKIERNLCDGAALTLGDAAALRQACSMMLRDCAAALDEEGVVSVSTARRPDGKIELKISDNGRLIPPEMIENIFEPYNTAPRAGGDESSLAYPAIFGIIRSHGGDISVKSDRRSGTVFTALLPGA